MNLFLAVDDVHNEWVTIPGDRMFETVSILDRLRRRNPSQSGEPISIFVMLSKSAPSSELLMEDHRPLVNKDLSNNAVDLYLKLMEQLRQMEITIQELKEKNPNLVMETSPASNDVD